MTTHIAVSEREGSFLPAGQNNIIVCFIISFILSCLDKDEAHCDFNSSELVLHIEYKLHQELVFNLTNNVLAESRISPTTVNNLKN